MLQRASCSRRPDCCAVYTTRTDSLYDVLYVVSSIVSVHKVALEPGTHCRQSWIQDGRLCWKSTKSTTLLSPHTQWWQSRPSWQQCQPQKAVEFKLLPICHQNWQQSWPYTATVGFVANLSPVCTGLNGLHSASAASGLQPIAACLMHISAKNSTLMLSACIQHGYRLINSSGMQ